MNRLGWTFNADLSSTRYEHPTTNVLDKFDLFTVNILFQLFSPLIDSGTLKLRVINLTYSNSSVFKISLFYFIILLKFLTNLQKMFLFNKIC